MNNVYKTIEIVFETFSNIIKSRVPNLYAQFMTETQTILTAIKSSNSLEYAEIIETAQQTSENRQQFVGAIVNNILDRLNVQRSYGDYVLNVISEYMRQQAYTTVSSYQHINETVFSSTAGIAMKADGSQVNNTDVGSLGPLKRTIPSEETDDDETVLTRKNEMNIISQKYFDDDNEDDYGADFANPNDWDYSPHKVRQTDDAPLSDEPQENKYIYQDQSQQQDPQEEDERENKWLVKGEKITGENIEVEISTALMSDAKIIAEASGIFVHDIKKKTNENIALKPYPKQSIYARKPLVYKSRRDPHITQRNATQEWQVKGDDAFGNYGRTVVYADDETGAKRVARELKGIEYDKEDPTAIEPYGASYGKISATQSGYLRRPFKKAFVRNIQVPSQPATVPGTTRATKSSDEEDIRYDIEGPQYVKDTYCTCCNMRQSLIKEGEQCLCGMNAWSTIEKHKKTYLIEADSLMTNETETFKVAAYDKNEAYNLAVDNGYLVKWNKISGTQNEEINEIDFSQGTSNAYGNFMSSDKESKVGSGRQCTECSYEFPKYKGRYPNFCPICGFKVNNESEQKTETTGDMCPNCKTRGLITEANGKECKNCGLKEQQAITNKSQQNTQHQHRNSSNENMSDIVDVMLQQTAREQKYEK